MTIQEAIKILKTEYIGDSEYMELAKQMGVAALNNLIPTKVNINDGTARCPICSEIVKSYWNVCAECGQALDWSE